MALLKIMKQKSIIEKEQNIWKQIEILNNKKKELIEQKNKLIESKNYEDAENISQEIIDLEARKSNLYLELEQIQRENNNTEKKRKYNEFYELIRANQKLTSENNQLKNIIEKQKKEIETKENKKEKYYKAVIEKNKEKLNEFNNKTITEIKNTINPDDLTIKNIVEKFKPIGYDFNKDYLNTLKTIYNFLKQEITIIDPELKILIYDDATTIIKNKITNDISAAIMLCSIMCALGDENAMVEAVLLEKEGNHAFVKTKYKNKYYIFDLSQDNSFEKYNDKNIENLYQNYTYDNKKIVKKIFNFNQNIYMNYL
ncbi:MAG TPA: hypothetical protein P5513_00820 [Candidatus Diapherotrites archaeon]|nr:hypothetical protein [Candidatus Diapherotrites archaeon]